MSIESNKELKQDIEKPFRFIESHMQYMKMSKYQLSAFGL